MIKVITAKEGFSKVFFETKNFQQKEIGFKNFENSEAYWNN